MMRYYGWFASLRRPSRTSGLVLDTLEYNGHVSNIDALWAGLPILSAAGDNMARRCGATLLAAQRLLVLLARNPEVRPYPTHRTHSQRHRHITAPSLLPIIRAGLIQVLISPLASAM